jgi:PKD repeat protein
LEYTEGGFPVKDHDPNKATPQFTFKVTNTGNMDEDGIEIRLDDIPPAWDYSPTIVIDTLNPGESSIFDLGFQIPSDESVGSYDMWIYLVSSVDPSEQSQRMKVTVNITKPDLTVSLSDISGLNDIPFLKGKIGESTTITARIHNIGQSEADMVEVKLFEEMTLRDTKTVTSIVPGGYYDVDFSWMVVSQEVELRVEIAPQIELDLGNNAIPPIFLDLRPDLSFTGAKLNFSNSEPQPEETIIISAFVQNTGGDAENVIITFYNSTEIIGNDTINLNYNEIKEATISWKVTGAFEAILTIRAEIYLPDAIGDGEDTIKLLNVAGEQVMNHAPVLDIIGHLVATEDLVFSYTATASDGDALDTLTFSDDSDLIDIDPATGEISFTPTNDDVGSYTLNITVTDSNGLSDSQLVVLTVSNANDAPVLDEIEDQDLIEDSQYNLIITATDMDLGDSLSFSDDTHLFDINPLTGEISFTPTNEDVGTFEVNITVSDKEGAVDYQTVTFTVTNVNDLPTIDPVEDLILLEGSPFTYTISASDVDLGDTLAFSDDTQLFDINPETGVISVTPSEDDVGTHQVTITVTDSEGGTDQIQVTITVLEKAKEPSEDPGDFMWILWVLVAGLIAFLAGFFLRGKDEEEPPEETENEIKMDEEVDEPDTVSDLESFDTDEPEFE